MKRFMAVLLIGLFSFALVAGCGKKQEEQPAMEQQQQADTTVTTDTTITTTDTVSSTK